MDVAELVLRARAAGIDQATHSLDRMAGSASKAETVTQRLNRENEKMRQEMGSVATSGAGVTRSLDTVAGSTRRATTASEQMARQNEKMRQEMDLFERSGQKVNSMLARYAGLAVAAFAGAKTGGAILDMAQLSSRYEQLGSIMEIVGRNAGMSGDMVNRYAAEVQAMGITMMESRQTVIAMTQAQLDLSRADELARVAQDAAAVGNMNSSEALGRLLDGIQTGNTLILRNIGINVQFEQGYRRIAAQLGKNVEQLTEGERAQSRMNQVLEAGIQIAGAYEASMDSANKQMGSTTRYVEDLRVIMGGVFTEAHRTLVFRYSDALQALHERAQELRDGGSLEEWGDALNTTLDRVIVLAEVAAVVVGARLVVGMTAAAAAAVKKTAANNQLLLSEANLARVMHERALQDQFAAQRSLAVASNDALRAGAVTRLAAANQSALATQSALAAATANYTRAATAAGVATRGLALAKAMLGGPAGIAIVATYGVYKLVDALWASEKAAGGAADEIDRLKSSMRGLQGSEIGVEAQIRGLEMALPRMALAINSAVAIYGVASDEVSRLSRELERMQEELKSLYALQSASPEIEATGPSSAFETQMRSLEERLALIGKVAEAERFAALLQAGLVEGLLEGEDELLLAKYRALDAALEHDRVSREQSTVADRNRQAVLDSVAALRLEATQLHWNEKEKRMYALSSQGAADEILEEAAALYDLIKAREDEQRQQREYESVREFLMTEEERIKESYARRRQIILDNTSATGELQLEMLRELAARQNSELSQLNDDYWTRWLESAQSSLSNFDEMSLQVIDNLTRGFGTALESMVFDSHNLRDAMYNLIDGVARATVNSLGQMAGQWIAYEAVQKLVQRRAQASAAAGMVNQATASVMQAGLSAYASTAAIPIVGPAAAPEAMAAAISATAPLASGIVSTLTAGLAGMAHDGIDSVPKSGTWLLEQGERVTTAETSAKLDRTLDDIRNGSMGGNVHVNIINNAGVNVTQGEMYFDGNRRQLDITIDAVRQVIGEGYVDDAMAHSFGLSRASGSR